MAASFTFNFVINWSTSRMQLNCKWHECVRSQLSFSFHFNYISQRAVLKKKMKMQIWMTYFFHQYICLWVYLWIYVPVILPAFFSSKKIFTTCLSVFIWGTRWTLLMSSASTLASQGQPNFLTVPRVILSKHFYSVCTFFLLRVLVCRFVLM